VAAGGFGVGGFDGAAVEFGEERVQGWLPVRVSGHQLDELVVGQVGEVDRSSLSVDTSALCLVLS
jgi:hypothetical protein